MPARRRRRRAAGADDPGVRHLACVRARGAARSAVRLSRVRPPRPLARPVLRRRTTAARSLRQGHVPARAAAVGLSGRGHLLRLGDGPAAGAALGGHGALRDACEGDQRHALGRAACPARHLRGSRPSGGHRTPHGPGRDRRRAAAGASVPVRAAAVGHEADELLGLFDRRVLRAARRLQFGGRPGRAGDGVQVDGRGAARGGHRGDSRRRLQPHGRRAARGTGVELPGAGERGLLPARPGRPVPLHRHDRHAELLRRGPPRGAAADPGLAAVLGHRDARRRLPLRPRRDPGPAARLCGPALRVLRPAVPGPGAGPYEAHRRAVGRGGARQLSGGAVPAGLGGVERPLPGHRP